MLGSDELNHSSGEGTTKAELDKTDDDINEEEEEEEEEDEEEEEEEEEEGKALAVLLLSKWVRLVLEVVVILYAQ